MKTRRVWLLLAAAGVACGHDIIDPPRRTPVIVEVAVDSNPWSVLSAVVTAQVADADSVAVALHESGSGDTDIVTPAVMVAGGLARVPVLGLRPTRSYVLTPIAWGGGREVRDVSMTFATGSLPADLPHYVASGSNPSPGFVAFAAGKYGIVIDNTGRVVWYRRFDPNGPSLNFQPQPNGRYVALPSTPDPSDIEPFVEVDVLGQPTRTMGCAGGLAPRFHDLIALTDGSWWIMCDEARTLDLTGIGGVAAARVTGTVVQHVAAGGALLFQWNPFDHFALTDLDSSARAGATVNWTHGNALDLDTDGNVIVSFRSLSEITKIDVTTGDVAWRLGGRRNEFSFQGAGSPAFFRQHGVRLGGPGLVMLDNLGNPAASRAESYTVDQASRTATLMSTFSSSPGVSAVLGGTTQTLPNGHTLVAYGNADRVEEYDASGTVVWRIEGDPGYVFRAERIQSLYRPGVGGPR